MCAAAQTTNTTRSLSLRDSIDLALRNNLDLKIERSATAAAGYGFASGYGAFDPNAYAEAAHRYDHMPLYFVADKANPDFGYKADSDTFGTGIRGKLPVTGLQYDLSAHAVHFSNVRTDFNLTPEERARFLGIENGQAVFSDTFQHFPGGIRSVDETYVDAGLTLRQPLLKNSWIDADRQQIQISKNQLQMSENALRGAIMKIITSVQLSYYDLIYARENIKVQQKALELAKQFLTETIARVKVGELTPLDQTKAEAHVETIQSDLFSAEQTYFEQQNLLKQYLTDDFNAWRDVELLPTENLIAVPEKHDRIESWQNALTRRNDILQAKLDLEKQHIILKYNRNQLLPSLDAIGTIGVRSADGDFGHAIHESGEASRPWYAIGGVLSFPIGNRAARNTYKASQATTEEAVWRMKRLEQDVLVQVDTAAKFMESALKRVSSTRNAREFAEKALEAERRKLEQNLVPPFIVMEAQRAVTLAASAEKRALADYNKARAQLNFAEGMTLERNNIRLDIK